MESHLGILHNEEVDNNVTDKKPLSYSVCFVFYNTPGFLKGVFHQQRARLCCSIMCESIKERIFPSSPPPPPPTPGYTRSFDSRWGICTLVPSDFVPLEQRSVSKRQACAVRNEDSRYEIREFDQRWRNVYCIEPATKRFLVVVIFHHAF